MEISESPEISENSWGGDVNFRGQFLTPKMRGPLAVGPRGQTPRGPDSALPSSAPRRPDSSKQPPDSRPMIRNPRNFYGTWEFQNSRKSPKTHGGGQVSLRRLFLTPEVRRCLAVSPRSQTHRVQIAPPTRFDSRRPDSPRQPPNSRPVVRNLRNFYETWEFQNFRKPPKNHGLRQSSPPVPDPRSPTSSRW